VVLERGCNTEPRCKIDCHIGLYVWHASTMIYCCYMNAYHSIVIVVTCLRYAS